MPSLLPTAEMLITADHKDESVSRALGACAFSFAMSAVVTLSVCSMVPTKLIFQRPLRQHPTKRLALSDSMTTQLRGAGF